MGDDGAQPRVLRLDRCPLRLAPPRVHRRELGVRRSRRPRADARARAHRGVHQPRPRGSGREPRLPRLLQVLRVLRRQLRRDDRRARARPPPSGAPDRAADRHLVLHLPRHQLRARHRPGPARARCASTSFALYMSFFPHLVAGPIVRASEFEPQLHRTRPIPAASPRRGIPPHRLRPVQEGGDVELPGHRARRPGLRRARAPTARSSCSWACTATPSRSTPTSPATRTSPSAARCCSASASRRTSTPPTARCRSRTSGGAGT